MKSPNPLLLLAAICIPLDVALAIVFWIITWQEHPAIPPWLTICGTLVVAQIVGILLPIIAGKHLNRGRKAGGALLGSGLALSLQPLAMFLFYLVAEPRPVSESANENHVLDKMFVLVIIGLPLAMLGVVLMLAGTLTYLVSIPKTNQNPPPVL